MPVSGLVVTLTDDAERREPCIEALRGDPRLTLGELQGLRLPVVTESDTLSEHCALWNEVEAMDGVQVVELAFHDFSDVDDFGERLPLRRGRARGPVGT